MSLSSRSCIRRRHPMPMLCCCDLESPWDRAFADHSCMGRPRKATLLCYPNLESPRRASASRSCIRRLRVRRQSSAVVFSSHRGIGHPRYRGRCIRVRHIGIDIVSLRQRGGGGNFSVRNVKSASRASEVSAAGAGLVVPSGSNCLAEGRLFLSAVIVEARGHMRRALSAVWAVSLVTCARGIAFILPRTRGRSSSRGLGPIVSLHGCDTGQSGRSRVLR